MTTSPSIWMMEGASGFVWLTKTVSRNFQILQQDCDLSLKEWSVRVWFLRRSVVVPDRFEDGVILLIGITGEDQAVCESQFGIDFHDFWVKLL